MFVRKRTACWVNRELAQPKQVASWGDRQLNSNQSTLFSGRLMEVIRIFTHSIHSNIFNFLSIHSFSSRFIDPLILHTSSFINIIIYKFIRTDCLFEGQATGDQNEERERESWNENEKRKGSSFFSIFSCSEPAIRSGVFVPWIMLSIPDK